MKENDDTNGYHEKTQKERNNPAPERNQINLLSSSERDSRAGLNLSKWISPEMHQIKNTKENKKAQRHSKVSNTNSGLPIVAGFVGDFCNTKHISILHPAWHTNRNKCWRYRTDCLTLLKLGFSVLFAGCLGCFVSYCFSIKYTA